MPQRPLSPPPRCSRAPRYFPPWLTLGVFFSFYFSTVLENSSRRFDRGLVLHVHLEEQQKEIDDCVAAHGMTPMALLLRSVPAHQLARCVAVHATHSDRKELDAFVAAGAAVCGPCAARRQE